MVMKIFGMQTFATVLGDRDPSNNRDLTTDHHPLNGGKQLGNLQHTDECHRTAICSAEQRNGQGAMAQHIKLLHRRRCQHHTTAGARVSQPADQQREAKYINTTEDHQSIKTEPHPTPDSTLSERAEILCFYTG